jgi:hypothetical protein
VQIPDPGLRDLASDLVSLVRDLVSSDAARARLRTNAAGILERLASAAARYAASLLPAGPVRQIAERALEGLRGLFAHSGGLAAALAQQARTLLPGVVRTVTDLLRDALQRAIPDGTIATLVAGLADEVLGLVGDGQRWQDLQRQGVGYLFSRLLPLARDFATSMLGRLSGDAGGVIRQVVESLFQSAGDLLASPQAIARFAQNAVSSLVSLGVGAVRRVVLDLVERATGSSQVAGFLRSALDELASVLANPSELQAFLRQSAAQAFGRLLRRAETLVEQLVEGVVRDAGLKRLATEGLKAVLAFAGQAVGGGGRNLGEAAKAIIARFLPSVAALAKEKLLGLFPEGLGDLKTALGRGFDRLVTFASGLVRTGRAAWDALTRNVFGDIVNAVLPIVKRPIERAVSWPQQQRAYERMRQATAFLAERARSFGSALWQRGSEFARRYGQPLYDALRTAAGRAGRAAQRGARAVRSLVCGVSSRLRSTLQGAVEWARPA